MIILDTNILIDISREIETVITFVEIDPSISEFSKELLKKYHLSHGLDILDSIIASTAIVKDAHLLYPEHKRFPIYPENALT